MEKLMQVLKETVGTIVIAAIITLVIKLYIIDNRVIPTGSMYPTIHVGDMVLVNKVTCRFQLPKRKDIVVFKPPPEVSRKDFIKRVIALPGETVEIKNRHVYINGTILQENYLNEQPQYVFGPVKVPEEHIFVLGDNRNQSYDSHQWPTPFVNINQVKGEAFFRYWPLDRIGKLNT
jgi:signal peptidase I